MQRRIIAGMLLLALAAGCSESNSSVNNQPAPAEKSSTERTEKAKPAPPPPPPAEALAASEQKQPSAPPKKSVEPESAVPPPGMTIEKAQVGVGDKGRGYGGGIISTPISTYFAARERIFFEIQLPEFIRAFEFENGRPPKSNEEFWDKVVKKNGLENRMPTLPAGHSYLYDPKTKQLMVVKPQ